MADGQTNSQPGIAAPYATAVQGNASGIAVNIRRSDASLGSPQIVSSSGVTTVYTPGSGKRVRLKWFGMSSPPTNTATTLVTVTLGGINIYQWYMGAPGAFAHSSVREGPVDGVLAVSLSVGQPVAVNMDVDEF